MTTAEILNAAADLIEPEGAWAQAPQGSELCVGLAITKAAPDYDGACAAFTEFEDFVGRYPITWNDAPGRTQPEVVQALRDAAKAAS